MFQRVQLGMPLKEGEKLQSLYGPWPAFCLELVKNYVDSDGGLHETLHWDASRGVGFVVIASVVNFIFEQALASTTEMVFNRHATSHILEIISGVSLDPLFPFDVELIQSSLQTKRSLSYINSCQQCRSHLRKCSKQICA